MAENGSVNFKDTHTTVYGNQQGEFTTQDEPLSENKKALTRTSHEPPPEIKLYTEVKKLYITACQQRADDSAYDDLDLEFTRTRFLNIFDNEPECIEYAIDDLLDHIRKSLYNIALELLANKGQVSQNGSLISFKNTTAPRELLILMDCLAKTRKFIDDTCAAHPCADNWRKIIADLQSLSPMTINITINFPLKASSKKLDTAGAIHQAIETNGLTGANQTLIASRDTVFTHSETLVERLLNKAWHIYYQGTCNEAFEYEGIDLETVYQSSQCFFDDYEPASMTMAIKELLDHVRTTIANIARALLSQQKVINIAGLLSVEYQSDKQPAILSAMFEILRHLGDFISKHYPRNNQAIIWQHVIKSLLAFDTSFEALLAKPGVASSSTHFSIALSQLPAAKTAEALQTAIHPETLTYDDRYRVLFSNTDDAFALPKKKKQTVYQEPSPATTPTKPVLKEPLANKTIDERLSALAISNSTHLSTKALETLGKLYKNFKAKTLQWNSTYTKEMPTIVKHFVNKLKTLENIHHQYKTPENIKYMIIQIIEDIEVVLLNLRRERLLKHTPPKEELNYAENLVYKSTGRFFITTPEISQYEQQLLSCAKELLKALPGNCPRNSFEQQAHNIIIALTENPTFPERIFLTNVFDEEGRLQQPKDYVGNFGKTITLFNAIEPQHSIYDQEFALKNEQYHYARQPKTEAASSTTVFKTVKPSYSPLQQKIVSALNNHRDLIPRTHLLRDYCERIHCLRQPMSAQQLQNTVQSFIEMLKRRDVNGPFTRFAAELENVLKPDSTPDEHFTNPITVAKAPTTPATLAKRQLFP